MNERKRTLLFATIGIANTALDIVIFLLLTNTGVTIVVANIISTGCALALSYALNKRFTFNDRLTDRTTILRFFSVTLLGLWILQPIIIYISLYLFSLDLVADLFAILVPFSALIAKLIATSFSLIWNYTLYKYIVFSTVKSNTHID